MMIRRPAALLVVLSLLAALPLAADQGKKKKAKPKNWDASITFVNRSDWAIHEIYISPTDEAAWGPDQLRNDTLEVGESFQLTGIECDTYDVKLVDEDGDECVVEDVDFCVDDQKWVIRSADLLKCQGWTR